MAEQPTRSPELRAWLETMPPFEGCRHALRQALALAGVRMGDPETTDYDRVATALLLRYGPDGPLTYDEIGARLGLSGPHANREVVARGLTLLASYSPRERATIGIWESPPTRLAGAIRRFRDAKDL